MDFFFFSVFSLDSEISQFFEYLEKNILLENRTIFQFQKTSLWTGTCFQQMLNIYVNFERT